MAYAAAISLKHTIEHLRNSPHISIVRTNPPIESAYEEVKSLVDVLKRSDSSSSGSNNTRVNVLDVQIREAVCKLEDVLESHVVDQFLSRSESLGDLGSSLIISVDLEDIRQEIDSFLETVRETMEEYIEVLCNPLPEEDDQDGAVSSITDFGEGSSSMVIFSDQFSKIRERILDLQSELKTFSLVGMAGIGKTALAKEIFIDKLVVQHFDLRLGVTIGPKYQLKEIVLRLLAQVDRNYENLFKIETTSILADRLHKSLCGRRYFIVLDDIWNTDVWDYLRLLFPAENNGSRLLLTTRLEEAAKCAGTSFHQVCLLDKEESWNLLREKVFAEKAVSHELIEVGRMIAENCEGLPLLIITIAKLLSKAEKTVEYWKKVVNKENSVFLDAYDEISEVLLLSYEYLPQHLKACFLYMGVFPQNYEIPLSKLFNLWRTEGFLEPNQSQALEDYAMECVKELVSKSLLMVRKQSSNNRIKTCKLHSAYWHPCIKEATKNKFLHVLNCYADGLEECIKSQRRLSVQNNILFGIKDIYHSMASVSSVRSLLCTGEDHQYPVPICFGLGLLRVLDALAIRLYMFPIEVLKLLQLRYLALTHNGDLPSSISKLWNLQCLIVRQYGNIRSLGDPTYLPKEIWDMQGLKHLQIMGRNIPDPDNGALLPNLLTLLDVSPHSCTKRVLESIPNLKKLGIQIELEPNAAKTLSCFEHISQLHRLESFKCVVMYPVLRSEVVAPPTSSSSFPSCLKMLSLNGFGYPWEYMRVIGSLPNLQELKLQCYAFQGLEWDTYEEEFVKLEFFLIEDTDLVHWRANDGCLPRLQHLFISHCYKLEEIPLQAGEIHSLQTINVVDCNPSLVAFVQHIHKEEFELSGTDSFQLSIHSSW